MAAGGRSNVGYPGELSIETRILGFIFTMKRGGGR